MITRGTNGLALVADEPASLAVRAFGAVVRRRFGLAQPARHQELLARRLRTAMRLTDFQGEPLEFVEAVDRADEGSPLLLAVADAVPNHETSFFRDEEQLSDLVRELLPSIAAQAPREGPLRILSAGCASGEEAYSLAILGLDALELLGGRSLTVAGFDVSPAEVEAARKGSYLPQALARAGPGPLGWRRRHLRPEGRGAVVSGQLRSLCSFRPGNLTMPDSLAVLGRFDVVVCRNLLIYFDHRAFERAIGTLLSLLLPGGALVLGRAELGIAARLPVSVERLGELCFLRPLPEQR